MQKAINNAKKDTVIQLSKDITCTKNGGSQMKVDGKTITIDLNGHKLDCNRDESSDSGHVIYVTGDSYVTLKDSKGGGTITGGYAKYGGGIKINSGAWLVFQGGTITGNKTDDEGGGLFNGSDCKLTIEKCTISGNTAGDEGGAIFNKGPLTVTGGVISGNTAKGGHGGGIRLWSNTASFTRVEITGNKCENGDGGAFYIGDATLTLTGGLYTNNTARVDGGAIYSKGNLTIKGNAVFKKNSATNSGGAIRVDGKTATIEDGTFSENWAGDHGGGIYVSASTLKLYGGSITNNTAWKRGGGMLVSSSGSIKVHGAPVIKDNKASTRGNDLYLGGSTKLELDAKLTSGAFFGVDSEKVFYTVRGASDDLRKEINDAKADEIDYAFTKNFYTYNSNSDFTRFFKTHDHFTLRRNGNEVAIRPSNWSKLQALVDAAENGDTIVLDRDYFSVKLEAALNIDGKKTLTIDLNGHKLDRGLTKPAASGAVIMNQGTLIIKDSKGGGKITGGYADDHAGGIWNPGTLTIEGGAITGNQCVNCGGGIYMSKGHPEFHSGVVTGNKSQEGDGGGIYIEDGTLDVPYDYIEITGNEAQAGNGGGVYIKKGALNMEGGKITGNKAQAGNGGGVYVKEGELKLYGGRITGNEAKKKAGGIYKEANQTCRVYIHGAPVVNENKAGVSAPNIFIAGDSSLSLDGALTEGAVLGVSLENDLHPITWAYKQHMGRADPEKYFIVEGDERICLNESDFPVICHSDWCDLQKEIDAAEDGATITLQRDWTGGRGAIPLYFNEGKTLTLDLNGHKLDRAARAGESYYVNDGKAIVIRRDSTLTIKDSVGTGVITGAYDGCIKNEGTLYLEDGTITGNYSQGGGAGVNSGNNKDTAYMKMTGGKITGNEAGANGGGLWSGDKLEILGGEITNNTAHSHGGGLYIGSMATIADGIRITGNITKASGGGIYLSSRGTLNLNGVTVTGNSATSDGGGIMSVGTLNVQGAPVVKDNTGTRGNNIFLPTGKVVNVVGPLSDDARLDLTAQDISNVLTKGLVKNGLQSADDMRYRKMLTYNNDAGAQPQIKNGELFVDFSAKADVYVKDWQGLQDAITNAADGTVIALSTDISGEGKGRIEVRKGNRVTIDLNGYTLDRHMDIQHGLKKDGHVIEIMGESTLIVKDTRGTGVITGGWATRGGGVNIQQDSTFILEGGTISGNGAKFGGGVYAHGTFKMTGGTISNNKSGDSGGGIHCGSDGALELTGGVVTGNYSDEDGGGIYNSGSKKVTITNVRIADNTARGKDKVEVPSPDIDAGIAEISFTHKDPKTIYYGGGGLGNEKGGEVTLKTASSRATEARAVAAAFTAIRRAR